MAKAKMTIEISDWLGGWSWCAEIASEWRLVSKRNYATRHGAILAARRFAAMFKDPPEVVVKSD
uniref:DUF1508 domain-containing protein n=1 Tax=viral metagenome TaxID=1070528 RepID=A0A6M3KCQ6_9ZZZZ